MMRRRIALIAWIAAIGWCAAAPVRPATTVIYEVRKDDTLSGLADAFLLGRRAMVQVALFNGIADPNLIFTRRRLRIPREMLRDEPTSARIEAFSGQVSVVRGGATTAAGIGQDLTEATMVTTGRNAFLTLRLADRSVVTVPSQTRLRILRLRRVLLTGSVEREFALDDGRLRMKVTPMPDGFSTFRVRTPVSHAAVRGTEFRAAYEAATGIASTAVTEGKVAVTTPGKAGERMVLPAFGIALGRETSSGPVPLLPAPELIDPGKVQSGRELEFALAPQVQARAYRIAIARDAGMLDELAESTSDTPAFTLPALPTGTYFAQVTAIGADGLEGMAQTYAFHRRRNGIAGTLLQSGQGRNARYRFKWEAETDGTPVFRFRLIRDADAVPMVDTLAMKDREIVLTALPPGTYRWRVLSTVFDQGKPFEVWSSEQRFVVAGRR